MADYKARRREHRDRGTPSPGDNNGEADSLDSSGTSSKLDISGESRVAARRRERAAAAAASDSPGDGDEGRGAAGGSSSRKTKDKKDSAKGGRFTQRKMREKRRGTGVVVLEDDDTANATASVKATTDYNEEITKKADVEPDHHGNGTTNSYETPTQRRQATPIRDDESANGSGDSSRLRSRSRRQGRESLDIPLNASSPSSPRSILRREVEGRTAEEWKRMYDREHRENRRLTRRLHEAEERTARLEDEIQILTEDLETADEELDRSREENRALNKAMSNLRS